MEQKDLLRSEEPAPPREPGIIKALIPLLCVVGMLFYNVFIYGDRALEGSNQFILILGGAIAAVIGFANKVSYRDMMKAVAKNLMTTTEAILILLLVGALAGTWLISGIIPTMVFYGLKILNPTIFLASCLIICAIISLVTGSSWTTSATVGIALIGIADALDISVAAAAGAIVSGAYFGDKLSPLSDTTNLAAAMTDTDLFVHIRYMIFTTVPTMLIALVVFFIMGLNSTPPAAVDAQNFTAAIDASFNISAWLFLVPLLVIFLIIKRTSPLIALLIGTLLGGAAALIFQPDIVAAAGGAEVLGFRSGYIGVMNAITIDTAVATTNERLNDLFSSGGMSGMLGTVWLIICAMVFGGVMEAIGALAAISRALLNLFHTTFGLFASTVASCLTVNITASDQYLSIVVPGKMFSQAYANKGLASENLSRTLEDSGTVTSALVPWNTCGAYQSGVLGVPAADYFVYAIFNWLSPFMTLLFAALNIKIKTLTNKNAGADRSAPETKTP